MQPLGQTVGRFKNIEYYQKIIQLFGSSLIAYYPLWEKNGTVVQDVSVNALNGVYSGDVIVNSVVSPVGRNAPSFGGTNSRANIYSVGLNSLFNGAEGSMFLWARLPADTWATGLDNYLFVFRADTNNTVYLEKFTTGNLIFGYRAGGVSKSSSIIGGMLGWLRLGITWSKSNDRMNIYMNGYDPYVTTTSLGTFAGALLTTHTNIGCFTTAAFYTKCSLAGGLLLNREATVAEVLADSRLTNLKFHRIGIIGDSISNDWSDWPYYVARGYLLGETWVSNRAAVGQSIMTGMDAQVAASTDDLNIIIIHMGTNDNNAGDMVALQAKVEANIVILKANNPSAVIYYMNVLPRWTDVGGGTEVDKSNIRTAIAAACTSKGIACWDTYTTPWIVVGDTSDGIHPTIAGSIKITTEILARLP